MRHTFLVLTALASVACVEPPESTRPLAPTAPLFAGGPNTEPPPQAWYSFADQVNVGTTAAPDWVPAGIQGDGRLRDGTTASGTPSNEYQGSFCGVWGTINPHAKGGNGNFNGDPDRYWSTSLPASCQPARHYRYYFNGTGAAPAIVYAHILAAGISGMASGEIRVQPLNMLGSGGSGGVQANFDDAYPPASSVEITRLPDVIDEFGRSVRQWRIATRGTHRAMGFVPSTSKKGGGGPVPNGITYFMPFQLTVTEVAFPFPTFP